MINVENPNALEYIYTLDNVTVSETNVYAVNDIEFVADYFPYGKVLRKYQNGDQERYLTTQHERDEETGLDYRGARYYDSDVARFLSLDPLAGDYPSWSAYNYVLGNPMAFIDPNGKEAVNNTAGWDTDQKLNHLQQITFCSRQLLNSE